MQSDQQFEFKFLPFHAGDCPANWCELDGEGGGGWRRSLRSRQAGSTLLHLLARPGRRGLCRFEALRWSEFHHSHEDCSMSFVRYFGEMVLKMERMEPCVEFRVWYLKVGSCPIDPEITDRQVPGQPQTGPKVLQESALI